MQKIINLIISLTFVGNLFSQVDTTKVAFVSYWSIGDSYDYKVSKIKQQWKEGKLTKNQKQDYIANFKVIDSTENYYTINWSYENNLGTIYNIPDELLHRFSKYKLTEIKYKTSELGEFIEILNWKEVGEFMNSFFDYMIEIFGEKDKKKRKEISRAIQPFKQIYSSKQGVEKAVLGELQYFHFPMGVEYVITEPIFYDEEIPNMFGGKSIKADSKLYFENVDFENGFCVVKQEASLNPNGTTEMLRQIFEQMKLNDKEVKKALATAVFEINEKNTYEYYYNPGIPRRIEAIREIFTYINEEKGKSTIKTIIELINNE